MLLDWNFNTHPTNLIFFIEEIVQKRIHYIYERLDPSLLRIRTNLSKLLQHNQRREKKWNHMKKAKKKESNLGRWARTKRTIRVQIIQKSQIRLKSKIQPNPKNESAFCAVEVLKIILEAVSFALVGTSLGLFPILGARGTRPPMCSLMLVLQILIFSNSFRGSFWKNVFVLLFINNILHHFKKYIYIYRDTKTDQIGKQISQYNLNTCIPARNRRKTRQQNPNEGGERWVRSSSP